MIQDILKRQKEEFNTGEYLSFSPPDWNEDNIKGYNAHKEDFWNFHTTSTKEILEWIVEMEKKEMKVPFRKDYCSNNGWWLTRSTGQYERLFRQILFNGR